MDAFRTLTGGSTFDRKRFAGDMNHFQKQAPLASTSAAAAAPSLPAELDFFASSSSAPAPSKKRKRTAATAAATATAAELPATDTQHDYAALLRKHKIKLTGLDLPEPVASVDDLVARRTKSQQDDTSTNDAVKRIANNWRALGYKELTGVQMAAWGTMLAGRDILACAPTGSGKTYSLILPLLVLLPPSLPPPPSSSSSAGAAFPQSSSSSPDDSDKVIRPRAVVIEPTRELSIQVLREARKLAAGPGGGDQSAPARAWKIAVLGEEGVGVPVAAQKGRGKKKNKKGKGTDGKKKEKKQEEEEDAVDAEKGGKDNAGTAESEAEEEEDERPTTMEATAEEGDTAAQQPYYGPVDILITTPLRLVFALKSNLVSLASTQHLILDEADKLFELNFLEQTDEILAACKRSAPGGEGEVRKGMFSATMPSTVEELAKGVMAGAGAGMVRAIVGHKEAATTTIDQSLLFVNREDHKLLSLRSLITSGQFTPPVLIFVQSIQRAKELANELVFDGINADAIHADRSASERDEVVRRFAEGQVWCLICTDVMARGVDFKGVKLVINYDFPQSAMSYIHRIGRTGRAGKAGRAITFFSKADAGHLKTIVNVMRASGCSVPDWMVALPNPSQNSKKQLKQRPIGRKDISRTLGAGALDDADEGARKGTGAGKKRGGGGGGKDGEHKAGGQGPKHKKQRIMSGVGSGFAGASAGGRGKATEQDAGAANGSRKNAAAAGQKKASKGGGKASASERPAAAKKAKREVALDE